MIHVELGVYLIERSDTPGQLRFDHELCAWEVRTVLHRPYVRGFLGGEAIFRGDGRGWVGFQIDGEILQIMKVSNKFIYSGQPLTPVCVEGDHSQSCYDTGWAAKDETRLPGSILSRFR